MSATASYALQGGRVEPYVTVSEVKFSPTCAAIDFTNLIPNASASVQDRALQEIIVAASAKADLYTMGIYGTLNATINTESGKYRPNRMGQIIVNPYFTPIIEVRDFKIGYGPGVGLQDITITNDNCFVEREQFTITYSSSVGLSVGPLTIAGGNWAPQTQLFCQWTYVNGWANTFTTTTTNAGDTSLQVTDPTGIYAGQSLSLWDGSNDEYVTVASNYDGVSKTIPLTAALSFKHGSGVHLTALPATVKQAVIHFVVALIKQRGQGGLVLNELGEPVPVSTKTLTSMEDEALGYELLNDFRVAWARF